MIRFGSRKGSGIDDLVERTLARARTAREPSSGDKERVLTALRDYIDDPSGAAPHEDGAGSGVRQILREAEKAAASRLGDASEAARGQWAPAESKLASSSLQKLALKKLALQKLALQKLVWVGAVTGGLGFWLGSQPEPVAPAVAPITAAAPSTAAPAAAEAPPEPGVPSPSASPAPSPSPASAPAVPVPAPRGQASQPAVPSAAESATPLIGSKGPSRVGAPVPTRPAVVEAAPSVREQPARQQRTPAVPPSAEPASAEPASARQQPTPRRPAPARTAAPASEVVGSAARASAPAPSTGEPGFLEAVRIIQRAQRSIERDAPHTALSLLDGLDARFPAVLLNEERLATRVLALCAIGATGRARRAAAELGARNPASIYTARIAQSCAGPSAPATRR